MGLSGDHYGMALTVDDVDIENEAFFRYCAAQDFRLQRATDSGQLRYPPTTRCPFSGSRLLAPGRNNFLLCGLFVCFVCG